MYVTTHHDYYFVFCFFILFNLLRIMCTTKSRKKNQIEDTEQQNKEFSVYFTVMYWVWVWIGSMFGFMYIIEENDY